MDNKREQQMISIQGEALELFSKKNADYGDAFADYGPVGVIVRMGDKIRRLQNITKNSVSFVKDESMRDTLIDLHNYAAMAVMLIDEEYTEKGLNIDHDSAEHIQTNELEYNLESTYNSNDYFKKEYPMPPSIKTPRNLYRQLTEPFDFPVLDPNQTSCVDTSNSVDL
tara:strand:+ start:150 stop:653 length:504 start_codon:yes stop_codon:yes gene_type:complete